MSTMKKDCIDTPVIETTSMQSLEFCQVIAACPAVQENKAGVAQLREGAKAIHKRIDEVNERSERVAELSNDMAKKNDIQDKRLDEINANISMLKGWNNKQDLEIRGLETKVIVDTHYDTFQEWIINDYIPKCGQDVNKFTRGAIYINNSSSISARREAYVNIRSHDSTAPCSINDWQVLPGTERDVIAIMGIDPIEVTYPRIDEFVVSINPRKLEVFLSNLESIDLSRVRVTLGEVYGTARFKDDVSFEENVNVEKKLTSTDVTVTDEFESTNKSTFNTVVIKGSVRENVLFEEEVHVQENVTVDNVTTTKTLNVGEMANINRAKIQDLHIPGYENNLQWIISDIYSKLRN